MSRRWSEMGRSWAARLNQNSFYKSVAWVAGGTAAAQAITLLSTPLVTRLYSPTDYGVFYVCMSLLGVIQPMATLTYATAIPLAENQAQSHNLLRVCGLITLATSLLLACAVLLFARDIASLMGVPESAHFLWILPLCLFGSGLYEALSSWAVREKRFRAVSATQVSQGISSAAVRIGLGLAGIAPLGLLLGLLASSAAGSSSLIRQLFKAEPAIASRFSWVDIREAAWRFRAFPMYRSWSKLILGFNLKLPALLVAAWFDPAVAGLFGLASAMVELPMSLVGTSVAKVFYAEIARFGKERPDKILALTLAIMKKMSALGILATAALMVAGPWMFAVVFGAEWYEAGNHARWLACAIMLRFVASPVMNCLDVLEMQGVQLVINIARGILILSAFLLARWLGFDPLPTVGIYAISLALFYLLTILGVLWLLRRRAATLETQP